MTPKYRKNLREIIKSGLFTTQEYSSILDLFIEEPESPFLDNHSLQPPMQHLHSFKPFGTETDLVIIYRETNDKYIFLDIGSHGDVYQQKG